MEKYEVRQLDNLLNFDLDWLVKQSQEEGFRFVERLVNDYKDGSNTFNLPGESLFGVLNEEGTLIAVAGLNKDPFSKDHSIGRIRRFYVSKEIRRNGLGTILVNRIIDEAKKYYKVIVLHTDTKQADKFYTSIGFTKSSLYPKSSHYMEFV
ncbi:GNAT family N-acetyltransferase [Oceanobacillus manasiensis]|uniref:GNAT family N-acetyltransferase n=1 Tax=Oceanobacillus manasiensis TaxID=586413 RepID=UPI0005A96590|nr:GNAT family N-acetyltransferase [Oceanobacillus manasiensis]